MSVYLCVDCNESEPGWFQKAWAKTGKKLDMGKVCIRFKKLEDLPLEIIGEAIRRVPVKEFILYYESVLKTARKRPSELKQKATKSAKSKSKAKS
jgi:hypothetical protein